MNFAFIAFVQIRFAISKRSELVAEVGISICSNPFVYLLYLYENKKFKLSIFYIS